VRKRWFAVCAVAAALVAAPAASAAFAVPGYGLDDGEEGMRAALGLLVPDAGPTTSEARARASLERGRVRNSLHGELPEGPRLIELSPPPPDGRFPDGALVVGIPEGGTQPNDRRYLVAAHAYGAPGLLTSPATRIPGLVSVVDVAPGRLGFWPHPDPVGYLRGLDERIRDNGRARAPAGALALAVIVALALVFPRAAVLAFATTAAANLALGIAGVSEPWLTVPAIGLGAAAAVPLALVARSALAAGAVHAGTLAAYLAALWAEPVWVALSPLGPSQNARFFGLSNLLAAILLVPALAGAALLWRRAGWAAFAGAAALALVTVGGSRFGADGGGALFLAAGLAVLAVALAGGGRRAWLLAGAGASAAVALVALDALAGPSTHVGRSVRGGPADVLGDIADRLVLSWERVAMGWGPPVAVGLALVLMAALLLRGTRGPLSLAVAAAVAVSLLVNDSPVEVAVGGAAALLAFARLEEARRYNPVR
jgi:hypothetical protein